jgi:hypothetical protein
LLSSISLAAAGGWLAAAVFSGPATGKEPRFPQLTMDQLTEARKPLGDQIVKVSSVGIGGSYNLLLRSPVLGQRLFDLFDYLRWKNSVPTRLNEFAIPARSEVAADMRAELDAGILVAEGLLRVGMTFRPMFLCEELIKRRSGCQIGSGLALFLRRG